MNKQNGRDLDFQVNFSFFACLLFSSSCYLEALHHPEEQDLSQVLAESSPETTESFPGVNLLLSFRLRKSGFPNLFNPQKHAVKGPFVHICV